MKNFYFILLSIIALLTISFVSCSKEDINEPSYTPTPDNQTESFISTEHTVNSDMLKQYLQLTKKHDKVESIAPLNKGNVLLAYLVQYHEGWDLISADCRCCPILASSASGHLSIQSEDPGTLTVKSMIDVVDLIKKENKQEIDPMWKLFMPKEAQNDTSRKKSNKQTNGTRSERYGIWQAIDTVYVQDYYDSGHIIQTAWGQGSPWNNYIQFQYQNGVLQHCKVGCVAVAAGQIIAHFRMANNRNIAIPTSGSYPPYAQNQPMTINSYGTSGWSTMANNYNGDVTQMFLAQIGQQLNMQYGVENSVTSSSYVADLFDDYMIDYYKIDYLDNTTSGSLDSGLDIAYVSADEGLPYSMGHAFIIDRHGWEKSYVAINYEWDSDHYQTEEEVQRLPQWMLEPMTDGKEDITEFSEYMSYSTRCFVGMNWGWGGTGNNITYTTYNHTSDYPIPNSVYESAVGVARYYNPNWSISVNGITNTYSRKKLIYIGIREHQ